MGKTDHTLENKQIAKKKGIKRNRKASEGTQKDQQNPGGASKTLSY